MKDKIFASLRIVISFSFLGLLFWFMRHEIRGIWTAISRSNLGLIVSAIGIFLINITALAYRLKIIFVGENLNISLKEALQLSFIGLFFNNFMPTSIGGDIIKAHYAAEANKKRIQSYASVLMDRFIGLYTFLVLAAAALLVDRGRFQLASVRVLIFVLLLIGIVFFIIATNNAIARLMERFFMKLKMFRLGERLHSVYKIVYDYKNRRDVVVKSFLVSIFGQCMYFIVVYLFFLSLGARISLGNIFLIMPVVVFISMIPSLGGLGVREGAIVAFFSPFVGKETAFAVSLLILFSLLLASLIGGIVYLWWSVKGVKEER